jgi:SNF2 family DNA or RNA helicase
VSFDKSNFRIITLTSHRLNLTSANRVFIVEPQWNPSVENQAIARAQRLGQGQSVLVTRYKMKRTVEEVPLSTVLWIHHTNLL